MKVEELDDVQFLNTIHNQGVEMTWMEEVTHVTLTVVNLACKLILET